MPLVVTVVVLIALVPLTLNVESPVTVLSKTAFPVIPRLLAPPTTVELKVTVVPLNTAFAPSVTPEV